MQNKRLNMLIKASVKSRKFTSFLFCLFVILSTVLILITVGIINPLWHNIDTKLNNHILNREIIASFSGDLSREIIKAGVEDIKNTPNVETVYRIPGKLIVSEESGALSNQYNLSYLHRGFIPEIVSGRCFTENETGVALVPNLIKDYNESEGKINTINGEDLVGKILEFKDEVAVVHKLKIVGSYDTTDPIFSKDEILIPRTELLKYNDVVLSSSENSMPTISNDKSYIVVIDSPSNVDSTLNSLEYVTTVYRQETGIDTASYNMAFDIILGITVFFILLAVFGFYMFLKNNVNTHTQELALYRAIGYKSQNIYYIILIEHLLLGIVSVAVGIAITCLINTLFINPYLYQLVGNTFMEITVNITAIDVISIVCGYTLVMLIVCVSAVRRSEKIDLTILLREV